jgi:hypothetical protein
MDGSRFGGSEPRRRRRPLGLAPRPALVGEGHASAGSRAGAREPGHGVRLTRGAGKTRRRIVPGAGGFFGGTVTDAPARGTLVAGRWTGTARLPCPRALAGHVTRLARGRDLPAQSCAYAAVDADVIEPFVPVVSSDDPCQAFHRWSLRVRGGGGSRCSAPFLSSLHQKRL